MVRAGGAGGAVALVVVMAVALAVVMVAAERQEVLMGVAACSLVLSRPSAPPRRAGGSFQANER